MSASSTASASASATGPGASSAASAGAVGAFRVETDGGAVRSLASKASRVRLKPSERVVLDTPGAGGYGPPAERSDDAIREDLESGKFSAPFVTRHYGGRGNSGT